MKKKIIAAAIAAAMLAPVGAQAAEWIQLSSWSYAEVSGFVSDGLLPENMKGISDYKRTINRGEFCELVYSVVRKSGVMSKAVEDRVLISDAGDYKAANYLFAAGCAPNSWFDSDSRQIFPEKALSRKWAAELICKVLYATGAYMYEIPENELADINNMIKDCEKLPEELREAIYLLLSDGIMTADDNGYFNPDEEMTIEQAVVAVARMYKQFPRIIQNDSESGEKLRDIGGGLTEEITDDFYYVKDGDTRLLALETDVYTKLLSCSYDGKRFVYALNFNDKTDVFDADSGELIYTIPAIVNELDSEKGYVYTVSSRFSPYLSGLWSMEFKELLPAEYSRNEINQIAANNMQLPKDEYRAADGWVYYSDWNDKGHIYRIDTNGENKQCLVNDKDCYDLYIDGDWLYFKANNNLHRVKPDGTKLRQISDVSGENRAELVQISGIGFSCWDYDEYESEIIDQGKLYDLHHTLGLTSYEIVSSETDIIYEEWGSGIEIMRCDDNGESYTATYDGEKLYKLTSEGKRECLSDFYIGNAMTANPKSGIIFFTNEQKHLNDGAAPIYMYDGKETKCISGEYEAVSFGFMYDEDKINEENCGIDPDRIGFITIDDINKHTYHILQVSTGEVTEHKLQPRDTEPTEPPLDSWELDYSNDKVKLIRQKETDNVYAEYNDNTENLGYANIVTVTEDSVYYIAESSPKNMIWRISGSMRRGTELGVLMRFNYITGKKTILKDKVSHWLSKNNEFVSTELGELCIVDGDSAMVTYPCKGIKRYGKTDFIGHMPRFAGHKNSIYKLDTDGNIVQLTDTDCEYITYVPNDPNEPIRGY